MEGNKVKRHSIKQPFTSKADYVDFVNTRQSIKDFLTGFARSLPWWEDGFEIDEWWESDNNEELLIDYWVRGKCESYIDQIIVPLSILWGGEGGE